MQIEAPPGLQGQEPVVFWSWRDNLQQLGVFQSLKDSKLPVQLVFWLLLGSRLWLWELEGQQGSQVREPLLFWGWLSSWLLLQQVLSSQPGLLLLEWQVSGHWQGS